MLPSINGMKDAMVRLYDESNKMNLKVFDEMFAPEFVSYGGAGFQDLHGAMAFRGLYEQFLSTFPDLHFRVDEVVAEGNLCGVRGTLSGMHEGNFMGMVPATHKRITWTGTAIFRFKEDGLMDARWQEWDGLSVMQQLGVVPTPAGMDSNAGYPIPPLVVEGRYTSPSQNAAMARRFIEEVWNKGNLDVAYQVFHPQATSPDAPTLPKGGEAVRMLTTMFRSAMPDYHIEILKLLADGDRVLMHFTQSGTQTGDLMGIPPSGKRATWGEMAILRFAGGHVVESFYNTDMLGMMQQLGVGSQASAKG